MLTGDIPTERAMYGFNGFVRLRSTSSRLSLSAVAFSSSRRVCVVCGSWFSSHLVQVLNTTS